MTIHTILEEFRQTATSERDKGDKFERLILQYLQTDPIYQEHFSQVWLWMDFPLRNHAPDTGIDLVAQETDTGNYCAIQCKFYDRTYTLEKKDIDSFFTASGTKLFSKRIIVSTTDKWSKHAEEALKNQQIPVTRITLYDLENSPIDWSQFSLNYGQSKTSKSAYKVKDITGKYNIKNQLKLKIKKQLRHHQQKALEAVMDGFKEADRGKLIMACGTGKTFTSLKIAEQFAGDNSLVLFLVPSISLLSQTLREWTTESDLKFHSIAVCSDSNVGKRKRKNDDDTADITVNDLPFPPTTNAQEIINSYRAFYPPLTPPLKGGESDSSLSKGDLGGSKLTVIFSTYQSIGAIADAQKKGLPEFDLIICDEAHRTTGVTIAGEDESYFVKVHDNEFIKGKKRLYMTATPKIYEDSVRIAVL